MGQCIPQLVLWRLVAFFWCVDLEKTWFPLWIAPRRAARRETAWMVDDDGVCNGNVIGSMALNGSAIASENQVSSRTATLTSSIRANPPRRVCIKPQAESSRSSTTGQHHVAAKSIVAK